MTRRWRDPQLVSFMGSSSKTLQAYLLAVDPSSEMAEGTREERPRRTALPDRTRVVLRAEERLQVTGKVTLARDELFDVVVCH